MNTPIPKSPSQLRRVATFAVALAIALAAYAILRVSKQSLYGMLAGLFLPVAAITCEAAYELYVALRRGL